MNRELPSEAQQRQWKIERLRREQDRLRDETDRLLEINLTPEQHDWVAQGVDKRCRMLVVPSYCVVSLEPGGVRVTPGGFAPLPEDCHVRNKHVGGGASTLPAGYTAYFIQHKSFPWVEEAQPYPLVKLEE